MTTGAEKATMESVASHLHDSDLTREIAFAEGFGPDADPNAPTWLEVLHAERAHRAVS